MALTEDVNRMSRLTSAIRRAVALACLVVAHLFPVLAQPHGESFVIPLGVYDKVGRLVPGITAGRVRIKGVHATVEQVEANRQPRRIILLIDMSAGMAGSRSNAGWQTVRLFIPTFLGALDRGDRVALHVFAERHEVLAPWTDDYVALAETVEGLPRPGSQPVRERLGHGKDLAEGIMTSVRAMGEETKFGDSIVLISNGLVDDRSQKRLKDVVTRLAQSGLRLFLVRVFLADVQGPPNVIWKIQRRFDAVVEDTGGAIGDPWDYSKAFRRQPSWEVNPEYVRNVAKAIHNRIRSCYRLKLASTGAENPSKFTVEILDETGRRTRDYAVAFPRYLVQKAHQ